MFQILFEDWNKVKKFEIEVSMLYQNWKINVEHIYHKLRRYVPGRVKISVFHTFQTKKSWIIVSTTCSWENDEFPCSSIDNIHKKPSIVEIILMTLKS